MSASQQHTPPWVLEAETSLPTIWAGMAPSGHGAPGRMVCQVSTSIGPGRKHR